LGCNYKSNTFEDLITLSLDLPQSRCISFEQCLNNFCKNELLKGENKYMCSNCKKKCEAKKRFSIEQSPRILIIHLKRFTALGRKINDFIGYPRSFSLKSFMSTSIDAMVEKEQAVSGLDKEIYDLFGVVIH